MEIHEIHLKHFDRVIANLDDGRLYQISTDGSSVKKRF